MEIISNDLKLEIVLASGWKELTPILLKKMYDFHPLEVADRVQVCEN